MLHGVGILILMDSGSTQNIINTNFACSNGLQEHGIYTTVLIGNGNKVPCHSASFNILVHIGNDIFHIDALLLDISNNIDIRLGMPMANYTWACYVGFHHMELLHFGNRHPYMLRTVPHCQVPTIVQALPAP